MYKVKCVLKEFVGDESEYPCHFDYKIGDEIWYDGDSFTGRICPGLLPAMMPIIIGVFTLGHKYTETIAFRYRGADEKAPEMVEYDGAGYRPIERSGPPARGSSARIVSPKGRSRGHHFGCTDLRTLAHFSCEPVDLSDGHYAQPFYRRAISILEKIESEPGISTAEIADRFTDFQKNEISPRLTPIFIEVLLEALEDMGYIEVTDGKATATGREPPSRPVIPTHPPVGI